MCPVSEQAVNDVKNDIPLVLLVKCTDRVAYKSQDMTDVIVTTQENNARFDECRALHEALIKAVKQRQ